MEKISYSQFCNLTTSLERFLKENPKVLSRPQYIQNKLHLASNNCHRLFQLSASYRKGSYSLQRIALAIIAAKFWRDNTIFENAIGDWATYSYMVGRLPNAQYESVFDVGTRARGLELFMFDI